MEDDKDTSLESLLKCKYCEGEEFYEDKTRGETTCVNCGSVISDKKIDTRHERRMFSAEEFDGRARTGPPRRSYEPTASMLTSIGHNYEFKDSSGSPLTPKRRAEIYRIRKHQIRARVHSTTERNLSIALPQMDRLCSQMRLADETCDLSKTIYRRMILKFKRLTIDHYVPASVYAACRIKDSPIILEELLEHCGEIIPKNDVDSYLRTKKLPESYRQRVHDNLAVQKINRAYRHICFGLDITPPVDRPELYIPMFVDRMYVGLDEITRTQIKKESFDIIARLRELNLVQGRSPRALAAASIYISGAQILGFDAKKKQREVIEVAGVTEVCLRNRYKEMVTKLDIKPHDY